MAATEPVTLYVVRHGETVWNVESRIQGHHDSELTPRGERQARAAGRLLADEPLTRAYVSSSGRTRRTLALMAEAWTKTPPVTVSDDLREIRHGRWEGLLAAEARRLSPAAYDRYRNQPARFEGAPGGEDLRSVQRRALQVVSEALHGVEAGARLLFVTHGVTTKLLLAGLLGHTLDTFWEPPRIEAGSVSTVVLDQETRRVDHIAVALPPLD